MSIEGFEQDVTARKQSPDPRDEQIKVLRHELYRAAEAFKALGMKINEADAREALALTAPPADTEEG